MYLWITYVDLPWFKEEYPGKFDICQTDYSIQGIFSLLWSQTWKNNIQANERLAKVKEKWSTIQFDVFVLSFIFYILMFETIMS